MPQFLGSPPLPMTAKAPPHRWPWGNLGWVGLSGLLMAMALPPLSGWPLAWVALVPLWWVVVGSGGWRAAAGYGLLWGIVYYGLSLVWITHLHPLMWMGIPWAGSIAIALAAWGIITLWGSVCIALWGAGLWWMARRWPDAVLWRVLAATALWCLVETLRNYSPLDWSPLGLTQSPNNLWILHWARLSGPTTLTALLVAVNGLWAEAVSSQGFRLGRLGLPQNVRGGRRHVIGLGVGLLILSHGLGWVIYQRATPANPDQALTLGLVQGNVPTREKLTPAGIRQAMTTYTEGYQALAAQGVDAVITPEGALPVIWRAGDPLVAALKQTVAQTGVPLWLGTFAPVEGEPRHYTQSLLELRPDDSGLDEPRFSDRYHARYNKVQLVPLGEYIPFEPVLGRIIQRLSPLGNSLVPGQRGQRFETSLGLVTVGICYESAYSRLFRQQTRQGASFIVTASNNDPYPPGMMAQHHAFDVLRAVESDRWAVRVTNTGLSGLVDNHGRTQWIGPPQIALSHAVTLDRLQTQTPYIRWGDWLLPLLVGGSVLLGWPLLKKR
ncbi:apolipoprotein N-acyltransferase [Leptolyngbya sp. BL0902]|uniref:apolipoprotein N-acyltransferase n=1 Tax=Leptolyngbya sp. BL0902 TaxID=1115757 RepID=UPI0018E849EA|nr:apolipoprotein N-acyltransferase [Leptolyngbya sp. BL0902]QQE66743.1 apolipoprotein N-acyltransferase [Leptolyngbya sp. BL0902]